MPTIKPGKYKHFKGAEYEVIGTATHSETEETLVVYRTLYGDFDLWVRPIDLFLGTKEIDGKPAQRFRYIGEL
jgi:hypothetical protein